MNCHNMSNFLGRFRLRRSGELYLYESMDYERMQKYDLTILASDGLFNAITHMFIHVTDANDNDPICEKVSADERSITSVTRDVSVYSFGDRKIGWHRSESGV